MKIEITLNRLDDDWWLELGINYSKPAIQFKHVITLGFVFFSIYIRWGLK